MQSRKFAVGEQVRLLLDGYEHNDPRDVYTVSRGLPAMSNVWQYRVKRVGDGQERAVSEEQLAKAGFLDSAGPPTADAQRDAQRIRNARAGERVRAAVRRSEQG